MVIFSVILILANLFCYYFPLEASESQQQTVNVTSYNPYSLEVQVEVKCDHTSTGWTYYKKAIIHGNSKLTLHIPSNVRNCQIWPKILW